MLANVILLSLHQQLKVQFEIAGHGPVLCHDALLHEVCLQALVVLGELHRVDLSELLAEDRKYLVCYRLAKLLNQCQFQILSGQAHRDQLLVNGSVLFSDHFTTAHCLIWH